MNEEQFTKLFKYIEDFRSEVNEKLDSKAFQESVETLTRTINGFVKRLDSNETEDSARDMRFERLLEWAREVSDKTGIPLKDL